jgi:hypothetical protein
MRSPPFPPLPFSAGLPKSKTNWLSFGRRANRSTAVSARKSCCVRSRVMVEDVLGLDVLLAVVVADDNVDDAVGFVVPVRVMADDNVDDAVRVTVAKVVFDEPDIGFEGAARAEEAKMAAAIIGVKSILRITDWTEKKSSENKRQ